MRWLCVFLLSLGLASPMAAQFDQTLYEEVFEDITTTQASDPIRNIGQAQHVAQVIAENQPAQTCAVPHTVDIVFEGAFTSTGPWQRIGAALSQITASGSDKLGEVRAHGAFPFLRLNAATLDTTNCQYTMRYVGTLFPFGLVPELVPLASQIGFEQTTFSSNTSGDTTVVAAVSGARICVYEFLAFTATAQTVDIRSASTSLIGAGFALQDAGSIFFGNSGRFHFCTTAGEALVVNQSGNIQLSGRALYRVE